MSAALRRASVLLASACGIVLGASCAEVGSGPDVPAAIELAPFPSPSVVLGDSLRTVEGVVAPVKAIVRNLSGDVIANAAVRYLYADYARDSALAVDSLTGIVRALRATTGEARIAARTGSSLQILKSVIVTTRPDSMDSVGQSAPSLFTTTFPDTGRTGANANTSPSLNAVVRHVDAGVATTVNSWPVTFEIISPANPTNDTTKAVFLVDDAGRASTLDTTDAGGVAGRKVRVRALQFPAAGVTTDSVIVRASATYRGAVLKGAPVRIALPVKRGS